MKVLNHQLSNHLWELFYICKKKYFSWTFIKILIILKSNYTMCKIALNKEAML